MVTSRPSDRAQQAIRGGFRVRPWRCSLERAAAHRGVQAFGCFAAACWASVFPLFSNLLNQAVWGTFAAPAYALAGLLCLVLPRGVGSRVGATVALIGAVFTPLALLAVDGQRQSEVMVVERSAALMLHSGSPYLPDPRVAADYNPYLPSMTLFGLPREALGGSNPFTEVLGDARVWFALAFVACLLGSWRLLCAPRRRSAPFRPGTAVRSDRAPDGADRAPLLPLAVLTASPLIALALVVGGVDLPLIGVCCLAMALAGRGRTVATGLVLALACTLKWTAWPALPVAVLLIWRLYGRRPAARTAAIALAVGAAVVLPDVIGDGRSMREQVVRFPLGLAAVRTPAGSPLPGKVLADLGPIGHIISITLLCVAALAVTLWLLTYPPTSALAACDLLAAGLTVAFMLAPAGRFGYLALPTVLVIWPRLATHRWTWPRRNPRTNRPDILIDA